jgi:hypothetical protein
MERDGAAFQLRVRMVHYEPFFEIVVAHHLEVRNTVCDKHAHAGRNVTEGNH